MMLTVCTNFDDRLSTMSIQLDGVHIKLNFKNSMSILQIKERIEKIKNTISEEYYPSF